MALRKILPRECQRDRVEGCELFYISLVLWHVQCKVGMSLGLLGT